MTLPPRPNNVGRPRSTRGIDGKERFCVVVDEIVLEQEIPVPGAAKLIYFQKLDWEDGAPPEYRLTYYIIGTKGKMSGRWVFGRFSLMIPIDLFGRLMAEARRKGWEGV